jgi:hypothetical protein
MTPTKRDLADMLRRLIDAMTRVRIGDGSIHNTDKLVDEAEKMLGRVKP